MDIRILQVFNRYLERGGEEASVSSIFESLSTQHAVDRYWFSSEVWTGPTAPPRWKQALQMLHNASVVTELRSRTSTFRPDLWLVHNVYPVGAVSVYRQAEALHVPIVNYIHNFRPFSVNGYLWADGRIAAGGLSKNYWREVWNGSWQDSRLKSAWLASVLTYLHASNAFRTVKAWVAISEFMRQKFIAAGIPADDVFTVPHFWTPLPSPPNPSDGGYFLFLGRLIEEKGVKALFRTWHLVESELGARAPQLIIAGSGPLSEWVTEQCKQSRNIRFVGSVTGPEKQQLIAGCRAMLAPSIWWEPLGRVTYEAYDSAKPMLAARSGGLTETVQHGVTGLLHEPGDDDELATQVLNLDSDFERSVEMGKRGRAWLLEHTSEAEWSGRMNRVFQHALR